MQRFYKNACFTRWVKRALIICRNARHNVLSLLKIIIRYDPYLQLRCADWRIAVVVYREIQFLQQNPPSSGMVVLGNSKPAAGGVRAAGVVVLGAGWLDAQILLDEVLGGLGLELVEQRLDGRVVLLQPLLQRDAEAALDDRMRRQATLLEVGGGRHPAVVENELLHGVKDRVLRPAEKGKLPG